MAVVTVSTEKSIKTRAKTRIRFMKFALCKRAMEVQKHVANMRNGWQWSPL